MSSVNGAANSMKFVKSAVVLLILAVGAAPAFGQVIETERIASGLTAPLLVAAPPGDFDRIFIVQQYGLILIMENDVLLGTPFLDI